MPPIWANYVEFNQWVNLEILRRFRAADIRLAYPTQTIDLRAAAAEELENVQRADGEHHPEKSAAPTSAAQKRAANAGAS
jgi:small-conductance mechanosensitive channel